MSTIKKTIVQIFEKIKKKLRKNLLLNFMKLVSYRKI